MRWPAPALSFRVKITAAFTLIVVGGTVISTLIGSQIVTDAMRDQARLRVRQAVDAARTVYRDEERDIGARLERLAVSDTLAEAVASQDPTHLPAALATARDAAGLSFLGYVDTASGRVVRHPDGTPGAAVPPAIAALVERARLGRLVTGTDHLVAGELDDEARGVASMACPDLPSHTSDLDERRGRPAPCALVMIAAAPVDDRTASSGVVYGGLVVNGRHEIVDRVDTLLYAGERYRNRQVGTIALLVGHRWVATNMTGPTGERATGTHLEADVARAVLEEGTNWSGHTELFDEWYEVEVEPLRNPDGEVVGAIHVAILQAPFLAARTEVMRTFLWVCLVGLVIVFLLTYLLTRTLVHPLEDMVAATKRIAAGDLDARVHVVARDELGDLAASFNNMLASLKTMNDELSEWAHTLEEKVRDRTEELVAVQARMAQSEKLASIGRLAAGVAHGLNNPLGGILAVTMLSLEDRPDHDPVKPDLELIVKQTLRCREIVKGLLDFSRQSDARAVETDVGQVVESALALLERQTLFQNVRTVRRLEPGLPPVLVDPIQLQEVVLNIVLNGVDAMEEHGTLTVETRFDPATDEVVIGISDTGKGIPPEVMPCLFEPFFTTKKVGKGTGLGLAIVHGIVSRAGGRVDATSVPGQTTFTVRLPRAPEPAAASASPTAAAAV